MRLRSAAMLLAAVLALPLHAATPPTPDAVKSAVEAVYNDPDLHGLKADRTLRFKPDDAPPKAQDAPDLAWLRSLVRWMSETGRWLVWLAGAIAVALLAVYLKRWLALRGDADGARTLALPSHVGDLDIRPDSLPDDIGAAVRALWQRGEARAALSLLYRGALSRLAHEHDVPVRAASTEGECITLAARHAAADASGFFARLVGLWQLAVYGARLPEAHAVLTVCDEFDARLPRRRRAPLAAKSTA